MRIECEEKNSDFSGPVLDIYFESNEEAFNLGILFSKISNNKKCIWKGYSFIRVPLIDVNEIGIAKIDEKK